MALISVASATPVLAQVTSPGELSFVHEDWAGPRNCAKCHEVGSRKTADQRCLSCHEPLAARIDAAEGYHATRGADCASCHREHRGPDVRLVRFALDEFDHASVGYALAGSHTDLDCAGCHNTLSVRDREVRLFKGRYGALTRTHLGLSESCAACHTGRDPHAGQFQGRECATCHDETLWSPAARFDHANARYTLTGQHRSASCVGCHREQIASDAGSSDGPPSSATGPSAIHVSAAGDSTPGVVVYRPLAFNQCSTCHRDAHTGEMGAQCASCHSTAGWGRIPRSRFEGDFDHAATAFPLAGRHAKAECASCHRTRAENDPSITLTFVDRSLPSYPRPAAAACASCHRDYHDGVLGASSFGPECSTCHSSADWAPAAFDVFTHDAAAFELTGAHRVVPCLDCHGTPDIESEADRNTAVSSQFAIRLPEVTCASCHMDDDPHMGQFEGAACETCHTTTSFVVDRFDHSRTRFALDGAHDAVGCAGCHVPEETPAGLVTRFRPLDMSCRSCHGEAPEPRSEGPQVLR